MNFDKFNIFENTLRESSRESIFLAWEVRNISKRRHRAGRDSWEWWPNRDSEDLGVGQVVARV